MRRDLPMILIRVIVGVVFLIEGALKFVFPHELGVGHFSALGLPFPEILGPLTGTIEIGGGLAVLLNFYAGDAALVLMVVLCTAVITTKVPILLGRPFGHFPLPLLPLYGVLSFLHEARAELCMIFASLAVLIDSGLHVGRRRRWYQGN